MQGKYSFDLVIRSGFVAGLVMHIHLLHGLCENQVISRKQMGLLNKMWEMGPCPTEFLFFFFLKHNNFIQLNLGGRS